MKNYSIAIRFDEECTSQIHGFFFVVVLVVLAGEAMVVPMELSTIQNLVTLDR